MTALVRDGHTAPADNLYHTLRIASAMCFIGHGVFGLITKSVWCNYFAVFGIGEHLAYRLMPFIGIADLTMGLSLLFYPLRGIVRWLAGWALLTALLRPLSGEPFAEFIERAGNYGVPLALLLLSPASASGFRSWWSRLDGHSHPDARTLARVGWCLRLVVFLLLLGHGWLNFIEKKALLQQYAGLGFPDPIRTAHWIGVLEMLAALSVLIRPARPLLLVLLLWKMSSELFYPHWELFEWIERGGSYGAILALYFTLTTYQNNKNEKDHRSVFASDLAWHR
jgi:uncharacterized membrane protein YphA (DoxX/SURF4 family)